MTTTLPPCPDCEGLVTQIGPIPATDSFAGNILDQPLSGGYLYRCNQCSLGFRWPQLSKEKLDSLYAIGKAFNWETTLDSRQDWLIARKWIEEILPNGSLILDVGCFDGVFLGSLVRSHKCNGIEIHPIARERAKEKGITLIGNDFATVTGTYDLVTAFDVIEHVDRPKLFLNRCLNSIKSGGLLLISTGDMDAFTFRLMGGRYWYTTIAEHISFVSPSWFCRLSESLNYRVVRRVSFAHSNASWKRRTIETIINLTYRFAGPSLRTLRHLGVGGKNAKLHPELADHPPSWMSAHDHFVILLQKR